MYKEEHGFSGFPVTTDGMVGSKLVGFVAGRDVDFITSDGHDTSILEVHPVGVLTTPIAADLKAVHAVCCLYLHHYYLFYHSTILKRSLVLQPRL